MDAEHDLLFGVLALQADLIDAAQFAEVCTAWAARKDRPLAALLRERGWITAVDQADVERLLERKLRRHGQDVRASLAAAANEEVRRSLAAVDDLDILQTVTSLAPHGVPASVRIPLVPLTRERYTLLRLHATGGIGQVWLARDDHIGRDVALKELLAEQAGEAAHEARFLREARITGQLEHPSIVPVYEVSRRPDNHQPFYTMRFVEGRTLRAAATAYHAKRAARETGPLDLAALLGAFVTVCQAVAYAHTRGVIHRDLKGENVILGDFGEVVVLDWGLAKTLGQAEETASGAPVRLGPDDEAERTVEGQVVGTPACMAPEQAAGRVDLIDQRTDVYGLGGILYEILTGRSPFGGGEVHEVLLRVQRDEPVPPRRVWAGVPPALEAACLKALAKDPAARYPSARDLAGEVQRWLADEPVEAHREPWAARLARWGRRHKPVVAGAAALAGTVVLALLAGTILLARANERTREQWVRAEGNLKKAQAAETTARAMNKFLTDDLLAVARPEQLGREVTIRQALDAAAPRIGQAFAGQPEVEASVRRTVGDTYYRLGLYPEAKLHLQKALSLYRDCFGEEHAETLGAVNGWAEVLRVQGRLEEAEALVRQNLEACRRSLGGEHPHTLTAVNNLGQVLRTRGRLDEAEPLFRESLEACRRTLGVDHPFTLTAVNNLALVLKARGKPDEAEPLYRENLETRRRVLGPNHPDTLEAVNNLAALLRTRQKLEEAEPLFRENLQACRRVWGPEHLYTLLAANNLADLLRARGNLEEAEPLLRTNLEACRRVLGPDHEVALAVAHNLAMVLRARKRLEEAEPLYRQNLEAFRRTLGPAHPSTLTALQNLALLLEARGQRDEAERLLRQALETCSTALGAGHPLALAVLNNLAGLLQDRGRWGEAEVLLLTSYETLKAARGVPPATLRQAVDRLVNLYEAWGKPEKAAEWRVRQPAAGKPTEDRGANKGPG